MLFCSWWFDCLDFNSWVLWIMICYTTISLLCWLVIVLSGFRFGFLIVCLRH